jgi:hypothetical protein
MKSCCRDCECSLSDKMSFNLCKINFVFFVLLIKTFDVFGLRDSKNLFPINKIFNDLGEFFYRINGDARYIFKFIGIFLWDEKMFVSFLHSTDNAWQQSINSLYVSIESELSKKQKIICIERNIFFIDKQ